MQDRDAGSRGVEPSLMRVGVSRPRAGLWIPMVLAFLAMVGCTRRDGMNFECSWPSDPVFVVDLSDPVALGHLLDDIGLAEELGVRYGDQNSGRRVAMVFGVAVRLGGPVNMTLG